MSAAAGGGVLAAIEDSINECNDVTCPQCRRLAKARAAVAELIAADKEYDEARKGYDPRTATPEQIERLARAELRRRRALSNIEGGK